MQEIGQGPDSRDAPQRDRLTLDGPIEVAKFFKNRWRRDVIVVSLSSYQGHNLVSVRTHTTGQDGKMFPTAKGVTLAIARLPELAAALAKALAKARELGLLPPDGEG